MTENSWPPYNDSPKPALQQQPATSRSRAFTAVLDHFDRARFGGGGGQEPEQKSFLGLRNRALDILRDERKRVWTGEDQIAGGNRAIKAGELMKEFDSVQKKGIVGLCASVNVIVSRSAIGKYLP